LLALLPLLLAGESPADAAERPNFVVVVFDDLGYADVGAYGSTFVQTPTMDRLAAEGARFTRFYANAPSCSPSRAAFLTGKYPGSVGLRTNVVSSSQRSLPVEIPTLAQVLKDSGYATGHFGKWHLGLSRPEDGPSARGFDRSAVKLRGGPDAGQMLVDGESTVSVLDKTVFTTDSAIEFMQANAGGPFFLSVWYHVPHGPWVPPEHWQQEYPFSPEGSYAGEVSYGDEQLGRIVDWLEANGLGESTLVLVTSDNGPSPKDLPSPLQGAKWDLHEGGIRVPFVAWWPGSVAPGRVEGSVAAGFDVAPTLCDLAQAEAPLAGFDGRSLAALLLGGQPLPTRPIVWESSMGASPDPAPPEDSNSWAVMEGDWKLLRHSSEAPPALHDLAQDPAESTDLAAAHPELVERLTGEYESWRRAAAHFVLPVESFEGEARAHGEWYELGGGAAVLASHSALRVEGGDVSFRARIWPSRTSGTRVIAEQPGSWSLGLQSGRVRLEAWDRNGSQVQATGVDRLLPGEGASIALSVFGIRGSPSQVRVYLDGRLQIELEMSGLAISDEPLRLGRGLGGLDPFEGLLWAPSFRRIALLPQELADRDGDGVPDASDLCIGLHDPPESEGAEQWDADGDGLGDSCDADFDGNGQVSMPDWQRLSLAFGSVLGDPQYDPVADFDRNGSVNGVDLVSFSRSFGLPPGPSGVACGGTALCYRP
jgi:arylsulfatase A-like enzyme